MKSKELRDLNTADLLQKEKSLKKELFDMRYQRKVGRVEKPARFKAIRKDIARILTVLNERKNDGK
ncbi:MAG TPA: 50S ribosomal protein L29 [Candidatus Omnitrophota bacterium]|nr:50S ribosomal protein L29 [Candidatus Omnitrophota bacterium]